MRKLDDKAGVVGYIIGMIILVILITALVGSVAYQISLGAGNGSVAGGDAFSVHNPGGGDTDWTNGTAAGIPGGPAILLLLGLIFIVVPLIIIAKSAR